MIEKLSTIIAKPLAIIKNFNTITVKLSAIVVKWYGIIEKSSTIVEKLSTETKKENKMFKLLNVQQRYQQKNKLVYLKDQLLMSKILHVVGHGTGTLHDITV